MPHTKTHVAVALGSSREEAVACALDLIRDEIFKKVNGRVMVKPNFLSSTHALSSTQAEAVRPVLAFLRDAGKLHNACIAEGGSRSTGQALDNFGYGDLLNEFGVEAVDLNHVPHPLSFEAIKAGGGNHSIDYADIRSIADTVISVPVAKTHDSAMVTLSVKNMMGCLRRVHRPRMHGIHVGDGVSRMAELLWNGVEGHPLVMKSFSGAVFTIVNHLRSHDFGGGSSKKRGLVLQIGAMAENLARMAEFLMPDIAVIDAFEAMEGDGPGSAGSPVDMGLAVAGTDPVACDAVMAHLMGFDPMNVGYIRLMHDRGLGVADISKITVIGVDLESVARTFKPHRNYHYQSKWREGLGGNDS